MFFIFNMKKSTPTFSIVIPAYNEAAFIRDCLRSLQAQHYPSFEVIVVDNNSTDDTASIATALGARVVKEPHAGVCWARQAGLDAARGDIIISTDADTTYAPDWLDTIAEQMKDSKTVAVGGTVTYTGDIWWANIWSKSLFGFSHFWSKLFGQPLYISACNLAFRKSAGIVYETNLTQGGDELAVLKQLKHSGIVRINRSSTVFTSGRRQSRGFAYTFFITFIWYYLVGYTLSRLTKRTVLGGYPAFRNSIKPEQRVLHKLLPRFAIFIILAMLAWHVHPRHAARSIESMPRQIINYVDKR